MGLGIMGSGMARRLLGDGYSLTVYNRSRDKAGPLATEGATIAESPRAAAAGAEIVVSVVADDAASRTLWLGDDGALAGANPGAVLIECSTLSVGWVRELSAAAKARECELLDAPVTGTRSHAAAGELNFLVGGAASALEKARPALMAMGRSITHVGPTGAGAMLKLINNFLCGVQAASLAEAVGLLTRAGLDRAKALEVLMNGAPGSPLVKTLANRILAGDATLNFRLKLMAKDLAYALAEGTGNGISLSTVAPALALFNQAVAAGEGEKDFSVILEQSRKK